MCSWCAFLDFFEQDADSEYVYYMNVCEKVNYEGACNDEAYSTCQVKRNWKTVKEAVRRICFHTGQVCRYGAIGTRFDYLIYLAFYQTHLLG